LHKIVSTPFIATLLILGGCAPQPHAQPDLNAEAWLGIDENDEKKPGGTSSTSIFTWARMAATPMSTI